MVAAAAALLADDFVHSADEVTPLFLWCCANVYLMMMMSSLSTCANQRIFKSAKRHDRTKL